MPKIAHNILQAMIAASIGIGVVFLIVATSQDVQSAGEFGLAWSEQGTNALPVATSLLTSLSFNDQIWAIGGDNGGTATRKVYSSSDGITWAEVGTDALPVATRNHCSLVFDDKMWVIGGEDSAGTALDGVYSSSDGATWATVGTVPPKVADGVAGARCIVHRGLMWALGGEDGGADDAAYSFDGASDKVDIGSPAVLDDVFAGGGTVEAWINANSDGEGNSGHIIAKGLIIGWVFIVTDESASTMRLRFAYVFSTTTGIWQTTERVITVGQTHHVTMSYDSSSVANDPVVTVDGTVVALTELQTPVGADSGDATETLIIGRDDSGFNTFDGTIDEVAIYPTILTTTQAADHYTVGSSHATNYSSTILGDSPVGYWRLGETSGNAIDASGNGNNGTVTGATQNSPGLLDEDNLDDAISSADGITWVDSGTMGPPRASGTVLISQAGFLTYIGGFLVNDGSVADSALRSEDGATWTTETSVLPEVRTHHGGVSADRQMYLFGGVGATTPVTASGYNDVLSSEDGTTWVDVGKDALPVGIHSFGYTMFLGKAWIVGGDIAGTQVRTVYATDDIAGTIAFGLDDEPISDIGADVAFADQSTDTANNQLPFMAGIQTLEDVTGYPLVTYTFYLVFLIAAILLMFAMGRLAPENHWVATISVICLSLIGFVIGREVIEWYVLLSVTVFVTGVASISGKVSA